MTSKLHTTGIVNGKLKKQMGGSETRVAGGRALGTIDNDERAFENGGEREFVVNATVLDLAVDGGEATGDGRRSDSGAGETTVDCKISFGHQALPCSHIGARSPLSWDQFGAGGTSPLPGTRSSAR